MSVGEKVEARADGDAVVGEKKKRTDDEGGDLAGDEDRSAQKAPKVDASESDAALARALGGVPNADAEPSAPPDLGLSEVRVVDSHPNRSLLAPFEITSDIFFSKTNNVRATAWRFAGSSPTTTT